MLAVVLGVAQFGALTRAEDRSPSAPTWSFFAFDNGVGRDQEWSPERQASTLARLGYSGIGYTGVRDLESRSKACKAHGLRIVSFYEPFDVGSKAPVSPGVLRQLSLIRNTGAVLWVYLRGDAPEASVVSKLKALADQAGEHGVRVAIYPHAGVYVETAEHALRLVQKVGRQNFGMAINVCHELRAGNADRLATVVADSGEHLFLVSINGASHVDNPEREHGWERLIQPLGEGDLDLLPFLGELRRVGYSGPIGLQCYRVPGQPEGILSEAMLAWKRLVDSVEVAE